MPHKDRANNVKPTDVVINHYGYALSAEKMKAKYERSEILLRDQLKVSPDMPFTLFNIAMVMFAQQRYSEVAAISEECLANLKGNYTKKVYSSLYFITAMSEQYQSHIDVAKQWAERGLEYDEDNIDCRYYLMRRAEDEGNRPDIIKNAQAYINLYNSFQKNPGIWYGGSYHTVSLIQNVFISLGCALWQLGNLDKANDAWAVARYIDDQRFKERDAQGFTPDSIK